MTKSQPFIQNNATQIVCLLFISLNVHAQTTFTSEQYREDLRFLQQTVHKNFPFLFKKTTAEAFDTRWRPYTRPSLRWQTMRSWWAFAGLWLPLNTDIRSLGYWEGRNPVSRNSASTVSVR